MTGSERTRKDDDLNLMCFAHIEFVGQFKRAVSRLEEEEIISDSR